MRIFLVPSFRAIALVAFFAAGAWATEENGAQHHPDGAIRAVVVCTTMSRDFLVHRAETIAASMFAEIGVQIVWHPDRACPPDAIRISFSDRADSNFRSAALAYALPYEATHIQLFYDIQVFYDRLRQHPTRLQPVLLAHVLVHEIAHILQGVSRHSASGIMMARWGSSEYDEMVVKPLRFTDEDIRLIRVGLQARESRLIAARE
jgi:hypothetical protein